MRKKNKSKSLGLGFVFIFSLVFLVLVALGLKSYLLFKSSSYDSNFNYNVEIRTQEASQAISLSPKKNSIVIVDVEGSESTLGIPHDISIENDTTVNAESLKSDLPTLLIKKGKLNPFDLLRIKLFISSVNPNIIIQMDVDPKDPQALSQISEVFEEQKILDEEKTIQIINATGEEGLGSRLAQMIGNMGGNVILVSTSTEVKKESVIEAKGKKSYTSQRLTSLLKMKTVEKEKGIADITVMVGEDALKGARF